MPRVAAEWPQPRRWTRPPGWRTTIGLCVAVGWGDPREPRRHGRVTRWRRRGARPRALRPAGAPSPRGCRWPVQARGDGRWPEPPPAHPGGGGCPGRQGTGGGAAAGAGRRPRRPVPSPDPPVRVPPSLPAGRTPSSASSAWRARAASRRRRGCSSCSAATAAPVRWCWRWWAPRVSRGGGRGARAGAGAGPRLTRPLPPDKISSSNPRVIEDARARALCGDVRRCLYYETCATYGLNVERVFSEGGCPQGGCPQGGCPRGRVSLEGGCPWGAQLRRQLRGSRGWVVGWGHGRWRRRERLVAQ